MVLPRGHAKKATKQQGRKDPSYRHHGNISPQNSPTAIALKKRSTTLPASFNSPSLSNSFYIEQGGSSSGGDDLAIRKARSEGIENAYEDFGVEQKLVELKPSQVKSSYQKQRRGRTSTYPGRLSPRQEVKKSGRPNLTPISLAHHEKSSRTKSTPVDIDTVSSRSLSRLELGQMSDSRKVRDGISTSRSVPTEAKLAERLDTERLLNQMGMDVTEVDYCIEGEFTSIQNNHPKNRCHSYDCNYEHPLESAYEDFGVERKLVDLKQPSEDNKKKRTRVRSMKKLVRGSLANIGNHNHSDGRDSNGKLHRHDAKSSNNNALKTKVLSLLRGNRQGTKSNVPEQIVATIIPTSSEDNNIECQITLDDLRLMHRWQSARIRSTYGNIEVSRTTPSAGKRNVEDVLSITSSCGEKTAPMDNRRRCRPSGFSC